MTTGILAFGAYVPRKRLQRRIVYEANRWFAPGLSGLAKGERAIANWDEDAVTMAVEAARDCLTGVERAAVATVMLASTSFPFADRQNAGIVKEALNLRDEVATLDVGASQKAGTGALLQAFRSARETQILVAASDKRRARPASEDELSNGDAAAAYLIGPGAGLARLLGSCSVSADFVDRFRAANAEFDYGWEGRWVRDEGYAKLCADAALGVLQQTAVPVSEVSSLIVGAPVEGAARELARKLAIPSAAVADHLSDHVGSAGCAHPLVVLANALERARPGDKLLVIGFGQGADALLLEATEAITEPRTSVGVPGWLARGCQESNYLRYLALADHLRLELGKRAEFEQKPALTALYRNRKAVLALVGGRCPKSGAVQFPKSDFGVEHDATVGVQDDYPLAERRAAVLTYTSDSLTFTPDPPAYYGMVEFEGGGRLLAEFTDVEPQSVCVGAPMRMVFRVKARDARSGFVHYFWKAAPAARSN